MRFILETKIMRLLREEQSIDEISDKTGFSRRSVTRTLSTYRDYGILNSFNLQDGSPGRPTILYFLNETGLQLLNQLQDLKGEIPP